MSPRNVDETLAALIDSLEEAGLRYALMGGYAVVAWGVPRATFDADVLVEDDPGRFPAFFEACERRGFVVDDTYKSGWRDRVLDLSLSKVQLFRDGRVVTCDVFTASTSFQVDALAGSVAVEFPSLGRELPVVSPVSLVVFKLLADRPKDRADVQNLLLVQDLRASEELRRWTRAFDVEDRLDRALADLDP